MYDKADLLTADAKEHGYQRPASNFIIRQAVTIEFQFGILRHVNGSLNTVCKDIRINNKGISILQERKFDALN